MKERLIAGIDIGSSSIRLAVGQVMVGQDHRESFNLIGAVESVSQGISKGAISSMEDAVSALSSCLEQAERQIGVPISEAYIGMSGTFTTIQLAKGVIGVSRVDGEIREEDVQRVLESARSVVNPVNFEILHMLPRGYVVDGQPGVKDPIGMQGIRLEADMHIVQGLASPVRNLTKTIFRTGVDISSLVFSPLATAEAVLTSRQKDIGVVLVNIGSSTTSVAVYEEGELLHAVVLPIGSDHITRDIAIGLRTSPDIAERIKQAYVSAVPEEMEPYAELDLRELGAETSELVAPYFISEIAKARAEEIFEKIESELVKIERSGMLPGGAVLTGGGARLRGLVDVGKRVLRLPVTISAAVSTPTPLIEIVQDPGFSTAIGLVHWGFQNERDGGNNSGAPTMKKGSDWMKKMTSPIKKIFKSFVP